MPLYAIDTIQSQEPGVIIKAVFFGYNYKPTWMTTSKGGPTVPNRILDRVVVEHLESEGTLDESIFNEYVTRAEQRMIEKLIQNGKADNANERAHQRMTEIYGALRAIIVADKLTGELRVQCLNKDKTIATYDPRNQVVDLEGHSWNVADDFIPVGDPPPPPPIFWIIVAIVCAFVAAGGFYIYDKIKEKDKNEFFIKNPDGSLTIMVKDIRFDMRLIQAGPNQTNDYYIGETEVTQELWQAFMGYNPSEFQDFQNPVENVSWNDCNTFIEKLDSLTKHTLNFHIPSSLEWRMAAMKRLAPPELDSVAWYSFNSQGTTHHVKEKNSNSLGIYDMFGNVWEWTSTKDDSKNNLSYFICGGGYLNNEKGCTPDYPVSYSSDFRKSSIGIRLACSIHP